MTNPIPTAPDQAELAALGRERLQLMLAKASAEKRMKEIDDRLRLLPFESHVAGPVKVSIQHNISRDDVAFRAAYPFEDFPEFYKAVPDTDSIKDQLAPAVIRRFQKEGAPKVVVSVFTEA